MLCGATGEARPRQVFPGIGLMMEREVKRHRQGETRLIDFGL